MPQVELVYSHPGAREVSVAGTFSDWQPRAMAPSAEGQCWRLTVDAAPGDHEFKFVVDGDWRIDQDQPHRK